MDATTYGDPMRVRRMTGNQPHFSTAVLQLTGVLTESAARKCAHRMPATSPRSQLPCSSLTSGRSLSPSAETSASKFPVAAHPLARATSSGRIASVSTGMNFSERPSGVTVAPRPEKIFTSTSRATAEC